MNIAKVVAEVGPLALQHMITLGKERGENVHFLEEYGTRILESVSDALLQVEHQQKDDGRAKFCAHIAADLLRAWPGEPSISAATQAVQIAKHLIEQSEKAYAPTIGFGG